MAGALVLEAVYPAPVFRDSPRARAGKHKLSSEAQQRMNQKYSWQKLELLLASNFSPGDLVCTFTYDDSHLPGTRQQADAKLKYFRKKLCFARRARGQPPPVMFWCTEHKHGDGRWHHHVVLNATGADYGQLRLLWGQGEIEIKPLRADPEKNYATLARYMCKESRDKVGLRCWSYTRNAKKPEVETFRVEADTPLDVPKGAVALEEASSRTEFGSYKFIKYLWNDPRGRRLVHARQRKRKRE